MSTTCKALFTLAALGLTAFAAHSASAQTTITAVTYASSTLVQESPNTQFSLGYTFMTTNALNVTALGYLNDGQTGANAVHNVEIYKITSGSALNPSAGTALFATPISVTTGANSPLYNTFSYTTLTAPVTLAANTAYEIVANNNGIDFSVNAQGVFYGGGIAYGASTYAANQTTPVFDPNTYPMNNIGNFGPHFQANIASAAPEPSQIGMLALAALGLGALVVKARKRSTVSQTA